MIALCLFFYPFVPTLGYLVNLWFMNVIKIFSSKIDIYIFKIFLRCPPLARATT